MLQGWETKREDFNVCLPREAIKINTSNYQAVLNFLGATSAQSIPRPLDSTVAPTHYRSSGNSSSIGRRETDFAAFTCIYLQRVLQLRDGGAFVNVKGENPPLKVYERRWAATLPRPNDFAMGKNRSELFIIEPRNRAFSKWLLESRVITARKM